jgi:hypothetical protein
MTSSRQYPSTSTLTMSANIEAQRGLRGRMLYLFLVLAFVAQPLRLFNVSEVKAWSPVLFYRYHCPIHAAARGCQVYSLHRALPATGADIEQPPMMTNDSPERRADIPTTATLDSNKRGKVNEIDFCIAPADVSLSRAYGTSMSSFSPTTSATDGKATTTTTMNTDMNMVGLSLTRALNNASNRAVRRILLARSWPSAEALNRSLRLVATMAREPQTSPSSDAAKCPVPRPILNVLTRKGKGTSTATTPRPRSRSDEEYVADQIQSFRDTYGAIPGYADAEDYLQCVLSLATSGIESNRVPAVIQAGVYDEAYRRILSVLKTVGADFVETTDGRRRIAAQLKDQDICWSVLDKLQLRKVASLVSVAPVDDVVQRPNTTASTNGAENGTIEPTESTVGKVNGSPAKKKFLFWSSEKVESNSNASTPISTVPPESESEDLGGVLLSAKEPTMTRQLNVLSNIVQRALLFGGDEELLVLAETLDADLPAFIQRWYPGKDNGPALRPGVGYIQCLIQLLRNCYDFGVVTDMDPPVRLSASYANAYERMVASAVELGSGYLKPAESTNPASIPKPRTAQEEFGRFALLESNFRQPSSSAYSPYPQDLVGKWEVRDEIGGETIGSSVVIFLENGNVQVDPPLEGLRWRLDPGPTHLDTCTFQVLSTIDRTILQYRGFIDRGARLEARFSKRPIRIRGSVMFQMRDGGSVDFYKDMLPINYRTGTTKFVMTKLSEQ